jgi:signal transduction histidine kinase
MLRQRFALAGAPFGRELILNREAVVIPDIRGDSPLAQDFRRVAGERFDTLYGQVRSWMSVPLMVKDQIVGILTLKHREPDRFTSGQAELVLGFANQVAVALENNRLYEQAQALAALEERQRLARDLHDAVSQTLFSASLAADVLPRLWESKPDEGRKCLTEVRQLTRGALAEMRTLLLELHPSGLVEVALDDLLEQLVEAASSRARIPIDLTVEGACALQPEVQVTLYRIVQEALSNIIKHAGAENAGVRMHCAPAVPALDSGLTEHVELWIQDDGCGFDPRRIPAECLGVSIMHERAAAIGAEIGIVSRIGQGTRVRVAWSAR